MANYFVINSKFRPYSFDELIKPYQMYAEAYNKTQDALDDLITKASSLEDLSPELDSKEYASYTDWKSSLKAASDSLVSEGLSPQTRNLIRQANNTYKTDYAPLLDKLKTRSALIKEQREFLQKNPNTIFDVDYSQIPVGQINSASTYNSYNLDTIKANVAQDVYNRQINKEDIPALDDYASMYSGNLTDSSQLQKIQEAITSGVKLGNATYNQKEFENYIKEITAKRTGRGSSRYSGTYGGGTAAGGSGRLTTVPAYDGTAINVSFNKGTKKYEIKNKDKKPVVLPDNYTADDVLRGYYGSDDYGYVPVFGTSIPRVKTTETAGNGSSRNVYSIFIGGKWKELPKGGATTKRELYKMITGENLAGLNAAETRKRGMFANKSLGGDEDVRLNSLIKENKIVKDDISNYHDYEDYLSEGLVKKLDALESVGAQINVTFYRDAKNTNNIVAWDIDTSGADIDSPIEYEDRYPAKKE